MRNRFAILSAILLCSFAWGQSTQTQNPSGNQSMPGMDMSGHDMSNMKGMSMGNDNEKDSDANTGAMHSMEGHMDMGPHMKMTDLRKPQPGDAERAQKVVDAARKASDKYLDYHVALADGFKIFMPNVPQKIYHFTNGRYAMESFWNFNPEHPTSLLYEKQGEGYKLVGVMYTAPKRFTEDQLNERVPLSVAQWHEHVNFCRPPADRKKEMWGPQPQFGLQGSITTKEACDAAGGKFTPQIFGWMVHVYPFEQKPEDIWSVERQAHNHVD